MPSARSRIAPVTTILDPAERQKVDAAGAGIYHTLHRDSLDEVVRDLRENRTSAVLVSVARCVRERPAQMASVIRNFPSVTTVALLSATPDANAEAVLTLGNCGIQKLVDVRIPDGWQQLRNLLAGESTKDIDQAMLTALRTDLHGVPNDCWLFFEALFMPECRVSTIRQLGRRLNVLPSTLTSRFHRARLPAPKQYLAYARLTRAARLLENPGLSVAAVANHLEFSSPQSFSRHVRTVLQIPAAQFRRTYDGLRMMAHFRQTLVLPYLPNLRELRPLAMRPGMRLVSGLRTPAQVF